jgi:hypothetical protein
VIARPESLPFGDGEVDAVCAAGLPSDPVAALAEFRRVVRDGGLVALATAGSALMRRSSPPEELAASFVHARLIDVEQRQAGSVLVSSGRVRR